MRKISKITRNGRPLQEILDENKEWLSQPVGKETAEKADLSGADLRGANIDFSCWPLWCGSKGVKVDRDIAAQLAAHFCALVCDDTDYIVARDAVIGFAKTSHRADDLGI
jgi:hypothetical protein